METKANYVVVGIFTVLAVLAAFGFVYWTAAIGDRGETATLRIRIPGSASGLGRGSAVLFNGVKVGDVRRVYIDVQNPTAAIADAEIDRLTPITRSTEADIGLAGLTGQANIELKGGSAREPNLLDAAEAEGTVAEITADPSAVTNLLQTAQDIFERTDRVLNQLEGFVGEVQGPLAQTVRNAEQFSGALAQNSNGIDQFLQSATALSDELAGASQKLDGILQAGEGLLNAVDRQKVGQIVANVEGFTADLREAGQGLDRITAAAESAAQTVNQAAQQGQTSLAKVDRIIDSVDPEAVRNTVANIEQATSTANSTLTTLRDAGQTASNVLVEAQKLVASVATRTEDVNRFITDAQQLASRLNQSSVGVDSVIGKVERIIDGIDPDAVRNTVASVERATGAADSAIATFRQAGQAASNVLGDAQKLVSGVANRTDDVNQIITDAQQLASRLNQSSVRVDSVIGKVDDLLGSDGAEGLVTDAGAALRSFRETADTISRIVNSAESKGIIDTANATLTSFRQVADAIRDVVTSPEAQGLVRTASETLGSFRTTAKSIEELATSPDVRTVVTNASGAATSFRQTADSLNKLLSSPQAQGLIADASQTLTAFRGVAETLNGRIGPIADNIASFSGQGLQGISEFVRSAQRSVTRIEEAVTDFERNPQRVLSGGEGEVRRYDGRARR